MSTTKPHEEPVRPPDASASSSCAEGANLAARRNWFNETYREWIEAQNRHAEQYGVFGEEWRPW